MAVTIKNIQGQDRFSINLNEGAKRIYTLMGDDYVMLPFSVPAPIDFSLGDYADIEGFGRFVYNEIQAPTYNTTTGGYDYELRLENQHLRFKNKLLKYSPNIGGKETTWSLTATIAVHAEQLMNNIKALCEKTANYLYNGNTEWSIVFNGLTEAEMKTAKSVDYDGTNIIDGFNAIAEAFECEWWVTKSVFHLGKCDLGNEYIDLEIGVNVAEMSQSSNGDKYATRIISFGSENNIASNYRKNLIFEVSTMVQDYNYPRLNITDSIRKPLVKEYFPTALWEERKAESVGISLTKDDEHTFSPYELSAGADYQPATLSLWSISSQWVDVANLPYNNYNEHNVTLGVDISRIVTAITEKSVIQSGWKDGNRGDGRNVAQLNEKRYELTLMARELGNDTSIKESRVSWGWKRGLNGAENEETLPPQEISVNIDVPETGLLQVRIALRYGEEVQATIVDDSSYIVQADAIVKWNSTIELKNPPVRVNDVEVEFISGALAGQKVTSVLNYPLLWDDRLSFPKEEPFFNAQLGVWNIEVGDRFKITNIYESRVPLSWFSSQTDALEDTIVNGIVPNRLLLPEGISYVDVYRYNSNNERLYIGDEGYEDGHEMPSEEVVEAVVVFDDVFPEIQSTIASLESQMISEGEDTTEVYPQYTYTDEVFNEENPFTEDYLLAGETLQMTFSSGVLNGWTFDVQWIGGTNRFTIVRNAELKVPNDILKPSVGDTFTLTGFNAGKLNESASRDAEQRLLEKTKQYGKESIIDPSTYNCTMMSDKVLGYTSEGEIDHTEALVLSMGRRVRLHNKAYFANGRESRVIGIEQNLDIPYDSPVYTIGEKPAYSRLGKIEDKIDSLSLSMGNSMTSLVGGSIGGGSSTYLISRYDKTAPSETNAYSALRARIEFMLRNQPEKTEHHWRFNDGLSVYGENAIIDKDGNVTANDVQANGTLNVAGQANVNDVVADGNITSKDFLPELTAIGGGYGITTDDANGQSTLTIDNIAVRNNMVVAELVIQEYKSVGGVLVLSVANGEIDRVTSVMDLTNGLCYECHIKDWEKYPFFEVGDLVRCSRWDKDTNEYVNYWVEVRGAKNGTIALYASDFSGAKPNVGDQLVQFGHVSDTTRQGLIIISVEGGKPNITAYDGINSTSLTIEQMKARLGNLDGIVDGNGKRLQGYGLWSENLYLGSSSVADPFAQITSKFNVISGKFESLQEAVFGNLLAETNQGAKNWLFGSNGVINILIQDAKSLDFGDGVYFERIEGFNAPWEVFIYPIRPELIVKNKTYTLSFEVYLANGTSSQMRAYINDGSATYTDVVICDNSTVEGQWVKCTATLRAIKNGKDTSKQNLDVKIEMVSIDSWVSLSIRNMMLNEGDVAMAYTPSDYDHIYSHIEQTAEGISVKVDDLNDDLKATGIDVKKGEITLTADKVAVKNNEGKTTAMFDEEGKLSTEVIDADKIITRQVLGINRENGQVVTSINIDGNGLYYTHYPVAYENGVANPNSLMQGIEQPHEGHYIGIVASKMGYDKPTDSVMSVFDTYGNPMWRMVIGDSQRYGIVTSFDKWELTGLSEMDTDWLTADNSALNEEFKASVFPTSVDFVKNGNKWEAKPTWGMSLVPLPPIAYKEFKAGENSAYSEFDKFVKKSLDYQVADYDFTSGITGTFATGTRGVQGVVNVAETEQMTTLSVVYTFYWYVYDNGRLVDSKSQGSSIYFKDIVK